MHLLDDGRAAQFFLLKIDHPPGQVFGGREETGRADVRIVQRHDRKSAASGGAVRVSAVFDDHLVVVVEVRVIHPERLKDFFRRKISERLAAHALDYYGQQRVPGVGIEMLLARLEVQFLLMAHHLQYVIFGDDIVEPPARHCEKLPLVAQAAGVVDQVPYGYLLSEVGHFRQVLAYVVVER